MENTSTISEAKTYLRANFEEGLECPCCGQFVKLYKRRITSAQAIALIRFYNKTLETGIEWHHVTEFGEAAFRGGDFAKLRYWGLIEESFNHDGSKKNSGYWKITQRGIRFITGQRNITKYIHIYNDVVRGHSEEEVSIYQALGNKFNYEELINQK